MGRRTKPRDPARERFWRRAFKRLERDGLSVRAFCEREGLAESAFYFWRRELKKRDAEKAGNASAKRPPAKQARPFPQAGQRAGQKALPFAAVTILPGGPVDRHDAAPPQQEDGAIEIVLRDSLRLRVRRGFDGQTLREVLRVLEGRPC